ncbi:MULTISPECIES: nucleoside triphosphate pyrophosphohydrolase, partial [unclassified Prochlorococcus]|uniref:nucleoside triphosphate pyrophosphohydrolase n=1 Tax=unclassified Prochlorococcus TaxID=2627481 RepID=UPI000533A75A
MTNKIKKTQSDQAINELLEIVAKLRDPNHGCPWDIKQNHKSLIPYAIEEAHEVADAIKYGNNEDLCDELGDLLLQVVLHAQIAKESNHFCFEDIAKSATKKMIRRHPHVFQENKRKSLKEVEKIWEDIKKIERGEATKDYTFSERLLKKIRSKAALNGSIYISKKSIDNGIELNKKEDLWETLVREITSLKNEIEKENIKEASNILGKLLFSLINFAISHKLDPEESLNKSNRFFLNRFNHIDSNKNRVEIQSLSKIDRKII